jgi:aminomethyltransferase
MTAATSRSFLPTPLHVRTAELCATNNWTQECGFTVPSLFTSPQEEQDAIISRVALCDLSARQCLNFKGPEAATFLSAATASDATIMEVGHIARTAWCDDEGYMRGSGSISRVANAEFELWSPVRDFAWFADAAQGFDVRLTDATGLRAVIGVRGPYASSLLDAAGLTGVAPPPGQVHRPDWKIAPIAIARAESGDGADITMPADDATVVWERLWRAGAGLGVAAVGAQVLDLVRIENGTAKAGIDWTPAHLARTPGDLRVPADLGFAPDLSRHFNGASRLRTLKSPRPLVFAQFAGDEPLAPGPVTLRGVFAGHLTSQAWSYARASTVALGWLDIDALKIGTKISAPGPTGPVRAEILRSIFG